MKFSLKKFKDIRIDNDLYQKDVANILNISKQVYYNYENGNTMFPLDKIVEFANYFNVSLNYLFGLSNNKEFNSNYKVDYKIVTKRILETRNEAKLSQEQFGEQLNIPQRTYASYENNERAIPIEILFKIAVLRHISLDYIVGRSEIKEII